MKRNTMLKILNPVLVVLFVNQTVSAVFRDYYSHTTFGIFHKAAGMIFICLIVLHIILNANWLKATYFQKHKNI